MSGKQVILITGANAGLGLEIVRALSNSDTAYDILVGSRKLSNATSAIETVRKEVPNTQSTLSELQIDIESDDSIRAAFEQVLKSHGHVDALINNAGAGFDGEAAASRMTVREAFNKAWDVNVSGTHVMTHEFVPLLLKSSNPRIIFMTSGTSPLSETERFDHPIFQRLNASPEAGWPKPKGPNPVWSYRASKTGLNMLMRQWVQTLRNDNVKIWAISPGFLATGLGGVGAETLKKVSPANTYHMRDLVLIIADGCEGSIRGRQLRQRRGRRQEERRSGQSHPRQRSTGLVDRVVHSMWRVIDY